MLVVVVVVVVCPAPAPLPLRGGAAVASRVVGVVCVGVCPAAAPLRSPGRAAVAASVVGRMVPARAPVAALVAAAAAMAARATVSVAAAVGAVAPVCDAAGLMDLLPLLLDEVALHGIVVVVVADEGGQLALGGEHGAGLVGGAALAVVGDGLALAAQHVLPGDLEVGGVLVVAGLVAGMVDADDAAANVGAAEVVDGQVGASLVLVLEPAEALALARVLVAGELEEDGLAKLGEDGDDVAL